MHLTETAAGNEKRLPICVLGGRREGKENHVPPFFLRASVVPGIFDLIPRAHDDEPAGVKCQETTRENTAAKIRCYFPANL